MALANFKMTSFPGSVPEPAPTTTPPASTRLFQSPTTFDSTAAIWAVGTGTVSARVWLNDPTMGYIELSTVSVDAHKLAICPDVIPRGSTVFLQLLTRSAGITALACQLVAQNSAALEETINAISEAMAEPLGGWTDHGRVNVPMEPEAGLQLPDVPCTEIKLIADYGNTSYIYCGGASVSSTDSQGLLDGDIEYMKRVSNANEIYVIATVENQKLRYQTR